MYQFFPAQKPLSGNFLVFMNMAAGITTLWSILPYLGQIEHFGEQGNTPISRIWLCMHGSM